MTAGENGNTTSSRQEGAPLGTPEQEGRRVVRATGMLGGLTAGSRLLGLARDMGQAALLGTGMAADAFTLAFIIPNILRRLFGEATASAALVPTYTERLVWGRGDGSTLGVLETDYGNIGGLICWEHWMPLARAAMHARHETLHISQWPDVKDLHQLASRHYAFEAQCFVLAAGCILSRKDIIEGYRSLNNSAADAYEILQVFEGNDEELVLKGGSAVIGPDSNYIAGPVFDRADIIYGIIDPKHITEGHLTIDTSGHYSRPDIFQLEVNTLPQNGISFTSDGK